MAAVYHNTAGRVNLRQLKRLKIAEGVDGEMNLFAGKSF
jgi:hypothetical protein